MSAPASTSGGNSRQALGLTARQQQCLDVIRRHIAEHGFPPTVREIANAMGIVSTNGVSEHLLALERKRCIRRPRETARGIVVLRTGREDLTAKEGA